MPELPDLEVFSHNLNKELKGKTLQKITIRNGKHLHVTATELNKSLAGNKLKEAYREGKQLRFLFENEAVLGMHLMLHGKLYWFDKKNTEKYTIAEFLFDDDKGLALTDYQGIATVSLNPEESDAADALSNKMTATYLKGKFEKTKKQVKDILLDQNIIRGIGNAYADEILWEARLSPFSIANKIPENKVANLAEAIKKVLKDAEKKILKTNPDIIAGEIRDFLLIHHTKNETSPNGATIKHTDAKSRKTYYTDEQELYK